MDFGKSWAKNVEETIDERFLMKDDDATNLPNPPQDDASLRDRPTGSMRLEDHGLNNPIRMADACSKGVRSFVLRNIDRLVMGPEHEYQRQATNQDIFLVVQDEKVVCAGHDCNRDQVDWPTSSPVFDMNGAVVIPVNRCFKCNRRRGLASKKVSLILFCYSGYCFLRCAFGSY
jgi:hypothetical protein